MRVKNTFSSFLVTIAGAVVPAPPPPVNFVWEKLAFTSTFRFKYQFRPTAQPSASLADVNGLEKRGNAASSMCSCAYRPTSCKAPHPPPPNGLNGRRGMTPPLNAASSPVNTHEPLTSQAVFC